MSDERGTGCTTYDDIISDSPTLPERPKVDNMFRSVPPYSFSLLSSVGRSEIEEREFSTASFFLFLSSPHFPDEGMNGRGRCGGNELVHGGDDGFGKANSARRIEISGGFCVVRLPSD